MSEPCMCGDEDCPFCYPQRRSKYVPLWHDPDYERDEDIDGAQGMEAGE